MRTRILALAALGATGCITGNPHSMVYGGTAEPLGAGRAEVAVSPGLMFEDLSTASQNTRGASSSSQTTTAITFPTAEGNVDYGLGDAVDLGVHLSLVGLQPDLKIAVVRGPINFAIAPEMAFGLAHASSAAQLGGSSNQSLNALTFLAGIKLLVSHESGAYAGLGYDFEHTGVSSSDGSGFGSSGEDFNAHNISAAFGYSTHGRVILRPELSFVFCPSQSISQTSGSFSQAQPNSNSFFVIMPTLTVALRSGPESERAHERASAAEDVRSAPPPQVP